MTSKKLAVTCVALLCIMVSAVSAELRMPEIFADHMVLQQGMAVPVWGWAEPGESVAVTFGPHAAAAVADAEGRWKAELPALSASAEPMQLTVTGAEDSLTFDDVLVGEVWFASGQSNMQWNVANSTGGQAAIADAANYPKIRLCTVDRVTSDKPLADTTVTWAVCGPGHVPYFSAVGYFFGRELHKARNVPVGIIHASWGGTPAEAWTSTEALNTLDFMPASFRYWAQQIEAFNAPAAAQAREEALAKWQTAADTAKAAGGKEPAKPTFNNPADSPHRPASLYNGMVAPVAPYAIRGAIWYQGESNSSRWFQYRRLMETLIDDWRVRWGEPEMTFLVVQLANFMGVQTEPHQQGATWPLLRDAQRQLLAMPKTGLACAIDVGEADDIHPRDKFSVGKRLALAARAVAYDESIVYSGPMYKTAEHRDGRIVLNFDHVGGGLTARGGELKGFGIAGEDGRWVWADAKIDGETVVLSSPQVSEPVSFCYGWANNPIGNLYNAEGLPAVPFSVDSTVTVNSTPMGPAGSAEVALRTGSDRVIPLKLSAANGATIEGEPAVKVSSDREAKVAVVAENPTRPMPVTIEQPSGRKIVHWLRPGVLPVPQAGDVVIDGNLRDWPGCGYMDAHWFDVDDDRFQPEMWVAWSDEALLVAGVLPGGAVKPAANPRQFWNEDCIELFIDTSADGVTGWGETSHQLWFCPVQDDVGQWKLYAGEFQRNNVVQETLYGDDRCETAMTVRDGAIVFEIAVPAAVLGKTPQAGEAWRVGLAVQRAGNSREWTVKSQVTAAWPRNKARGLLDGTNRWGLLEFRDDLR